MVEETARKRLRPEMNSKGIIQPILSLRKLVDAPAAKTELQKLVFMKFYGIFTLFSVNFYLSEGNFYVVEGEPQNSKLVNLPCNIQFLHFVVFPLNVLFEADEDFLHSPLPNLRITHLVHVFVFLRVLREVLQTQK